MALIKCNGCGRMISNRASFCPHCGYKVQGSLESKTEEQSNLINNEGVIEETGEHHVNKTLVILVVALAAIVIGFGGYMFLGSGNQNDLVTPSDTLTKDSIHAETVKSDTVALEKPIEVIASRNAIGTIERGMLAKVAVPMLTDPSAKGDFYDRVEIEMTDRNITEVCYEVVLYKGKEKLCSFETDYNYSDIPSKKLIGNRHITFFSIYSPSIKLQNGIYVGMTAKELVEKYHAKIRNYTNVECSGLEFVFNEYPEDYSFIAKGKVIHSNMEVDEADFGEEFLNLNDVKDCSLKQIDF